MTIEALHEEVAARTEKWLGQLPTGWRGGRLNEVAAAWTSNVDKLTVDGQQPVRLCNYTDVYKNDRITGDMDFMAASATEDQVRRFRIRRGDTIITKDSETADDIGVPAYVDYEADDLVCGYHLAIVRPKPDAVDPRFLYWVLESAPIRRQWTVLAAGVTRVGLRSPDLSKVTVPVPQKRDQTALAQFLDRETVQIDSLIAEQEQFIALLDERKRATLDEAFRQAPTTTLRRHVLTLRQGWSPNCESYPADGVREWGVLKLGCTRDGRFDAAENKRLPSDLAPRPEHVVRRGEVVMSRANTRDLVGAPAVVHDDYPRLMLSDLNYGITMRPTLDADFAVLSLLSPRTRREIEARAKGTSPSMQKLSQRDILDLPLWVPDIPTQRSVAKQVENQFARVDALIKQTREHIELAKERRAALIAAAVTGQIDVTGKVS